MKHIWSNHCILILIISFITIIFAFQCKAQSSNSSNTLPRQLDSLLQDYAYQAFNNPMTGKIYNASVPSNLTGIKLAVLRLRSGSLSFRGVKLYEEFQIPSGIIVQPYVTRLAFVYQNLGNWSSFYYPLPGYTYLTPIVGLLAYNAANLSATNLKELDIIATKLPISVKFVNVNPIPNGLIPKCVWFDLNGTPEFKDLVSPNGCSTYRQGHFAIVVNVTGLAPSPSPTPTPTPTPTPSVSPIPNVKKRRSKLKVLKSVVVVICGFIGLVLLALIMVWISRCWKNMKVKEMERRSEISESLQMAQVGRARAPVALGTRTQPILENEYSV